MQAKDRTGDQVTTLGLQISGKNWLVDMSDISEVLPLPPVTRVPMSKSWFRGVVNVRGNLYCVADMASYLDKGSVDASSSNRILLVSDKHAFNAALLVDRALGLRDTRAWKQSNIDGQIEFVDDQGITWKKMDVTELLNQNEFLQVGF
jgi:twitching motility protein PilI